MLGDPKCFLQVRSIHLYMKQLRVKHLTEFGKLQKAPKVKCYLLSYHSLYLNYVDIGSNFQNVENVTFYLLSVSTIVPAEGFVMATYMTVLI